MNVNNRKLGNRFEKDLAKQLANLGFWVHLLKQNVDGQPADIIAVKDNRAVLIDAKVCSGGKFRTDRIESNQEASMQVWRRNGNQEWWFACLMPDGEIRMLDGIKASYLQGRTVTANEMNLLPTLSEWRRGFEIRNWSGTDNY